MTRESRSIDAEGEAIDLDPFAFWPDLKSRLVGLGGPEEGTNPDYVFHSLYVSCGTGPIVFTVTFDGLAAPRGTLILRVHELPEVMGAHARQIAMSQTQVVDIIRGDGTVTLAATARSNNHYAVLGHLYGDMVATAQGVTIEVARRTPDPDDPTQATQFRAGANRVGTAVQIVGEREGTLVTPVSQLCTVAQMREPVLEALLAQFGGLRERSPVARWETAYIARVLDRYDVARSGARGLGIGAIGEPVTTWLLQHGCFLLLTSSEVPAEHDDHPVRVEVRQLDPATIDGPTGFDFAWAARPAGVDLADRQAVLTFIENLLRTLKAGGLLVVTLPIDVAPRPIGDDDGPLLRRPDIDRLTLLLLSRGHQVAQLCPWGEAIAEANEAETVMASAFGLVVRKAA